ncbi:Calponin domain [Trinorchestia longiramus]|nr:Calponin domain [Trinorchestia longiramus]
MRHGGRFSVLKRSNSRFNGNTDTDAISPISQWVNKDELTSPSTTCTTATDLLTDEEQLDDKFKTSGVRASERLSSNSSLDWLRVEAKTRTGIALTEDEYERWVQRMRQKHEIWVENKMAAAKLKKETRVLTSLDTAEEWKQKHLKGFDTGLWSLDSSDEKPEDESRKSPFSGESFDSSGRSASPFEFLVSSFSQSGPLSKEQLIVERNQLQRLIQAKEYQLNLCKSYDQHSEQINLPSKRELFAEKQRLVRLKIDRELQLKKTAHEEWRRLHVQPKKESRCDYKSSDGQLTERVTKEEDRETEDKASLDETRDSETPVTDEEEHAGDSENEEEEEDEILYVLIEENTRQLERLGQILEDQIGHSGRSDSPFTFTGEDGPPGSGPISTGISRDRPSVTRRTAAAEKRFGIVVSDFGCSWRDGNAFLAIVQCINPRLVNLQSMSGASNKDRLELAFKLAERHLGVASLLDAEDVDVDKPDEKSVMTYVAQFLNKYPEPGISPITHGCVSPTLGGASGANLTEVELEYSELTTWLDHTSAWLDSLQHADTHHNINYEHFKSLQVEAREKQQLYERLKEVVESQSSVVSITQQSWQNITQAWRKVWQQLQQWAWLQEGTLPGTLGPVARWLSRAEALLGTEEKLHGKPDQIASSLSLKIEEHKQFFSQLGDMQATFESVTAQMGGAEPAVSHEQVQNMRLRLKTVAPRAALRKINLQYLEHRYCLIAFLILVEAKLKTWAVKYGRQDEVQTILNEYRDFVGTRNIFQEFDRAFQEMQQVSEIYKKDSNLSKADAEGIGKFLLETNERWRNISVELRCIQSLLEEVISYWHRFQDLSIQLKEWLAKSRAMVHLPEQEKMDFFQDLAEWKERHDQFNETGNFLIATSRADVAKSVRDELDALNASWETVFMHVQQYLHRGQVQRTRNDHTAGQQRLELWLHNANLLLSSTNPCTVDALRAYSEQLKVLSGEVEQMELLFKNISKSFQALVQELSPEDIEVMMLQLKREKEQLVRVRAAIPHKTHAVTQVMTQLEAVDSGVVEVGRWLDEAEALLHSFSLHGTKETIQKQLEQHRNFFSRQLYFKSMLDTKNRVYQSLLKSSNGGENLDVKNLQLNVKELNERFNKVAASSSQWESRMTESIRCWESFKECESEVADWLQMAEKLYQEKEITTRANLEKHKDFFIDAPENLVQKVWCSGQELQRYVAPTEHPAIEHAVTTLKTRWDEILGLAPLHLLKMEFRLDENTFLMYMRDVERELLAQHNSFNKAENVDTLRRRHEEYFDSELMSKLNAILDNMKVLSAKHALKVPSDPSLKEDYERCLDHWAEVQEKIAAMAGQLQQIPEHWRQYENR